MSINREVVKIKYDILTHDELYNSKNEWGTMVCDDMQWSSGYIIQWKSKEWEHIYSMLPSE